MRTPKSWRSARLGILSTAPVQAGVDYSAEGLIPGRMRYLRTTDIKSLSELGDSPVGITESQAGAALIQRNDILLTRSGSLGTSYIHLADRPMAYAGYLVRVRPNTRLCVPKYLAWWTQSEHHLGQIRVGATRSTIDNFSASKFSAMATPLPPLETQRRIADFLDRETAEIDAMDADLDRLIETLQERRVATVDAQLTEQRDVPEVGLGLVADAITGLTYAPDDIVDESGTVVHRSGSIQNNQIDRSDLIRVSTEIPQKLRLRKDDILVCSRNGSAHLVGKNALVGECEVGETWGAFMTVVRSPYARYLLWYLRSSLFSNERGRYSTSTINQLTIGTLRSLKLPFPSTGEQRRIVAHLDRETAEIDSMIEDARRLKEVLAERRSVLISDVVTGRKEVPA